MTARSWIWKEPCDGIRTTGDRICIDDTVAKIGRMDYNFMEDNVTVRAYEDLEYLRRMENVSETKED